MKSISELDFGFLPSQEACHNAYNMADKASRVLLGTPHGRPPPKSADRRSMVSIMSSERPLSYLSTSTPSVETPVETSFFALASPSIVDASLDPCLLQRNSPQYIDVGAAADADPLSTGPASATFASEYFYHAPSSKLQEIDETCKTPAYNLYPPVLPQSLRNTESRNVNGSVVDLVNHSQQILSATRPAALHGNPLPQDSGKRSSRFNVGRLFSRNKRANNLTASGRNKACDAVSSFPSGATISPASTLSSPKLRQQPDDALSTPSQECVAPGRLYSLAGVVRPQTSDETYKKHIRKPPRGRKEWFDAFDEDDKHDVLAETESASTQLHTEVLPSANQELMQPRHHAEVISTIARAGEGHRKQQLRKPTTTLQTASSGELSSTPALPAFQAVDIPQPEPPKAFQSDKSSYRDSTRPQQERSTRLRNCFHAGESVLSLSDSDDGENSPAKSPDQTTRTAPTSLDHSKIAHMAASRHLPKLDPVFFTVTMAPLHPANSNSNDSSTLSNYQPSSRPSSPTASTSNRNSWMSTSTLAYPLAPSSCGTSIAGRQPRNKLHQASEDSIDPRTGRQMMAVSQEEALLLANMRRKRAAMEHALFTDSFKRGIQGELRQLERLQARALSTLELHVEVAEAEASLGRPTSQEPGDVERHPRRTTRSRSSTNKSASGLKGSSRRNPQVTGAAGEGADDDSLPEDMLFPLPPKSPKASSCSPPPPTSPPMASPMLPPGSEHEWSTDVAMKQLRKQRRNNIYSLFSDTAPSKIPRPALPTQHGLLTPAATPWGSMCVPAVLQS